MSIKKIIFDDNTEEEFIPVLPEGFNEWNELRKNYLISYQRQKWEKNKLFHHLETDLEDYAKDEFDLVEEIDLSNFYDSDILEEAEKRGLHINTASLENENILNKDFVVRFIQIINRGSDIEIGDVLENLEKKYHIK